MGKLEFFRVNPQYRLAMLDHFANGRCFEQVSKVAAQVSPIELYEAIKADFGKHLGDQNVLVAWIIVDLIVQRKVLADYQQRIDELEKKS